MRLDEMRDVDIRRAGSWPSEMHPAPWLGWLVIALQCLSGLPSAQVQPVAGSLWAHDPVMIKADSGYYCFYTWRGIGIKYSKDRKTWQEAGKVFSPASVPAWHKDLVPRPDTNIWAPDIHYRNGLYHLYYSVSEWGTLNSAVGYATNVTLNASDPRYRWVDKGVVVSHRTPGHPGVNVIDPNVFIDDDGKIWLLYGSYRSGLRMLELNPATGLPFTAAPAITVLTNSMGEGVYLIKRAEYYYIFASTGICCAGLKSTYRVVVGRSRQLKGPYLAKDGGRWLDGRATDLLVPDPEHPGQGHNGFLVDRDTTLLIYHAYTRSLNGTPLLTIRPMFIDKDGWPTLDPAKAVAIPSSLARSRPGEASHGHGLRSRMRGMDPSHILPGAHKTRLLTLQGREVPPAVLKALAPGLASGLYMEAKPPSPPSPE